MASDAVTGGGGGNALPGVGIGPPDGDGIHRRGRLCYDDGNGRRGNGRVGPGGRRPVRRGKWRRAAPIPQAARPHSGRAAWGMGRELPPMTRPM